MQKYAIVNTDSLNLRANPSTSAQVVSLLMQNTILQTINAPSADWLEVRVDGTDTHGFVASNFVTLTDVKPQASTGGQHAEVTTNSLNIRSGPGTNFPVLTTVGQGSVLTVLDNQGNWIKVKVGTSDGYASTQYLNLTTTKAPTGYLIEQTDLLTANLIPSRLIPDQAANTTEAVLARTWNTYGGLLGTLATQLNCPANGIVATLTAESGGNCFGPDGRMIIRFENHIFRSQWGQQHADQFNQFFSFNTSSPANGWKDHMFRPNTTSPFQAFHGNQSSEWQALTIARALDDTAALSSISMGAPQIMGFNFQRLGYDKVQTMFYQFTRSANVQLLAMFDFVRGTNTNSAAIQALRTGDYLTFASIYNGPANATTYRDIITRYVGIFNRLILTAR
ncbi:MAG: N-acetylmuramidase domain-containing protein [Chloroflexota bacterium]